MTFTDEEMKKCFQILDELLEEYNIPNKLSPDGISRIDGYVEVLGQNAKLRSDNFFVKSTYQAGTGKT